jgi:hypothetical protein
MTWGNGADRSKIYSELVMRTTAVLCHTWTKLGRIGVCWSNVVGSDSVERSVSIHSSAVARKRGDGTTTVAVPTERACRGARGRRGVSDSAILP